MHTAGSRRNWRTFAVRGALGLVAAFAVFEIGVRLLPPDAVRYSARLTTNGEAIFTKSGTITDPATVARWHAAMTQTPSGKLLWQGGGTCAPLSSYAATYTFLWHGLPVEVVSSLPICGDQYVVSSGGIPDPGTYIVTELVQP